MKILFVAPRFHTNQYPTSKELIAAGHEVYYLVQDTGVTEDYRFVNPRHLKLSPFGRLVKWFIFKRYDRPTAESMLIDWFFPSYLSIKKTIKEISPDLVILRDRIPSSVAATKACKKLGIKPVILYNQNPLYSKKGEKQGLIKRYFFSHCPQVRYTISKIHDIYDLRDRMDTLYIKEHEYFVPYVAPFNEKAEGREYFRGGKLNILDMGKFRPYKNHYLFINAIALLRDRGELKDIAFTILGQASYDKEIEYFNEIAKYIEEKGLSDLITLRKNIPYKEMGELYTSNDVFCLCSHAELASISVLEAMSNGVIPLSTSHNGTAFYIQEGKTGFTFRTEDVEDLAAKIKYLSDHRDLIPEMGRAGYEYVRENCMFRNFFLALDNILRTEFDMTLATEKTAYITDGTEKPIE